LEKASITGGSCINLDSFSIRSHDVIENFSFLASINILQVIGWMESDLQKARSNELLHFSPEHKLLTRHKAQVTIFICHST